MRNTNIFNWFFVRLGHLPSIRWPYRTRSVRQIQILDTNVRRAWNAWKWIFSAATWWDSMVLRTFTRAYSRCIRRHRKKAGCLSCIEPLIRCPVGVPRSTSVPWSSSWRGWWRTFSLLSSQRHLTRFACNFNKCGAHEAKFKTVQHRSCWPATMPAGNWSQSMITNMAVWRPMRVTRSYVRRTSAWSWWPSFWPMVL